MFKRNHLREMNKNVFIQTNVIQHNIPEQIETDVDNLKCVCVHMYVYVYMYVCVYVYTYTHTYIYAKLVE